MSRSYKPSQQTVPWNTLLPLLLNAHLHDTSEGRPGFRPLRVLGHGRGELAAAPAGRHPLPRLWCSPDACARPGSARSRHRHEARRPARPKGVRVGGTVHPWEDRPADDRLQGRRERPGKRGASKQKTRKGGHLSTLRGCRALGQVLSTPHEEPWRPPGDPPGSAGGDGFRSGRWPAEGQGRACAATVPCAPLPCAPPPPTCSGPRPLSRLR